MAAEHSAESATRATPPRVADASPGARLEDVRFLVGRGRFLENITMSGCLHAAFVRAPIAHGRIRTIDPSAALRLPGVVAVFTAADLAADGVGALPAVAQVRSGDDGVNQDPPRPVLATDRVRHVGDPVALVIARSVDVATGAAGAVTVDYDELPAVVDPADALAADAVRLWPGPSGNLCFDWRKGDKATVDAAFARAARLVRLTSTCNRVAPSPLETRAAAASYDADGDRVTLYTPSQGVHLLHELLCGKVFRCPPERMRVVTDDVGGGFGLKFYLYPEQAAVAWAARRLRTSVRWIGGRTEAFVSDIQARDQTSTITLALDADGRFLALDVDGIANLGAYLSTFAAMIPSEGAAKVASGPYAIPAIHMRVRGVFTNTVPVDAYRGAGKPEMAFLLERVVDLAARETGRDPLALRRLNLIAPASMPYATPLGIPYDSGDFPRLLEVATANSDRAAFAERRRLSLAQGKRRGFGIACYMHVTGGFARERSRIRIASDGCVHAFTGTQSNGHGHETAFAQVAAKILQLPPHLVRVHQGDTAALATGGGTGGSSSTIISANTLDLAARAVVARGTEIAAHVLEAAAADIVYEDGAFAIAGTDRRVALFDLARHCEHGRGLPDALAGPLQAEADFPHTVVSCPAGAMTAEVEVDPETGVVTVDRLVSVQDIGTVVSPALVAGQVHGGIAQSLGQALLEHVRYDPATGALLTPDYMSYALPRAVDVPPIDTITLETPSPNNRLGIKGVGELCTIGAPAAIINAVVDALAELGVRHIDMPATAERVWRAIGTAAGRAA